MANLEKQNARFHSSVLKQLQTIADERKITVSEVIREAVNVYLSGENSLAGLAQRVGTLEQNIIVLVESMRGFVESTNRNFELARETEKVRLQGIVDLIKSRVDGHENEEKKRMNILVEWLEKLVAEASNPAGKSTGKLSF